MYNYPYNGACLNSNQIRYQEYERDSYYFSRTLNALKIWNKHYETGERGRPVIPVGSEYNLAERDVQKFFDKEYNPERPLNCERFDEAADLLDRIVKTYGMEGLYSFFKVLSQSPEPGKAPMAIDEGRFKDIVRTVFVPHFEPHQTEEIIHGVATVGHVVISALAGLVHAPLAAASAMRFSQLRSRRLARREEPSLDVIENMMPLLDSMHALAQHSLEVLNRMEPIHNRTFPNIAPIDMKMLQTALENLQNGNDIAEPYGLY